jgi:hypothetical protein
MLGAGINPQASDLIKPIMDRALSESLTLDRPTRFPFRVDLPDFADAVQTTSNKGGKLSLISFMCQRLFENLDVRILPNDLREWLGACPSLIVLDGLDEVPQTANRGQLISSIDSFWDDLHLVQADAMVVVTTRLQ